MTYKKYALIITLLLLLLTLVSAVWIYKIIQSKNSPANAPLIADIYQNGVLLESIRLDTVSEAYTLTVTGKNGAVNEIEVRPGSIGIRSANCPDRLCVQQGFIQNSLLPITCLPNRLVIELRTQDTAVDGISY